MNRRQSLKILGVSTVSAGLLLDACRLDVKEDGNVAVPEAGNTADRQAKEIARDKKLNAETFFTSHEMATITVLGNIIIPKDEHSGNASDAKVPEFIEFIVKDMPEHQVPMRGGLKWLDMQSLKRYNNAFKDCDSKEQLALIDEIAYPAKAKAEMKQGVSFFNRIRNLTAIGFFTSKIGMEDVGYVGNRPNRWEGVPADLIKQYGLEDVKFG